MYMISAYPTYNRCSQNAKKCHYINYKDNVENTVAKQDYGLDAARLSFKA